MHSHCKLVAVVAGCFGMGLLARQVLVNLLQPHAVGAFANAVEPGSLAECEQAWLVCCELPQHVCAAALAASQRVWAGCVPAAVEACMAWRAAAGVQGKANAVG